MPRVTPRTPSGGEEEVNKERGSVSFFVHVDQDGSNEVLLDVASDNSAIIRRYPSQSSGCPSGRKQRDLLSTALLCLPPLQSYIDEA